MKLHTIYEKRKTVFIIISVYLFVLMLYDIIFFRKSLPEMGPMYFKTIIACVATWFGVKLVLWVLKKNDRCTPKVFNFFSIFFIVCFLLMTITSGMLHFANGFNISAFVYPIAVLSIIYMQLSTKNK